VSVRVEVRRHGAKEEVDGHPIVEGHLGQVTSQLAEQRKT